MDQSLTRRSLLGIGCTLPLLALPGCATTLGDLGLEGAVRRLLTISSQRAFANLLTENGFFENDVARVSLPPQLGGSAVTNAMANLLGATGTQTQLLRLVNRAAATAAEGVAPLVYDSIRDLTITDALAIARGGPTAATDYLQQSIGSRIVTAMFPGVGNALRLVDNGVVTRALQLATGINFGGLQSHVTEQAARGIWRAIGREESNIRANPSSVDDPVLRTLFAVVR